MNSSPIISIIIPLFNKEDFIADCLGNIQNQTERNWECIIINDGSTDSSEKIAKKFAQKDHRFRVFTQKNSGPSAARNRGIKEARGKLVHFMDADDFYPTIDTLKDITKIYKSRHPRILSGNIGVLYQKGGKIDYGLDINSDKIFYQTFAKLQNDYFFMRFFVEREFILEKGITFPEYTYVGEDPIFLIKALSQIDKYLVTNVPVYVYNTLGNSNNNLSKYDDHTLLCYIKTQIEILEMCRENNYKDLTRRVIDRVNNDMIDIYVEKSIKNDNIRKALVKLLGFIDPDLYYQRVLENREKHGHIRSLESEIAGLNEELFHLRQPGVKTAVKKLAGSIKRKIKKILLGNVSS